MRSLVSVYPVLIMAVGLVSMFLDLMIRILILIVMLSPNLGDNKDDQVAVASFVEDVMGLSWVVLLVQWGQDGIRRVSVVRFVMSCWSM